MKRTLIIQYLIFFAALFTVNAQNRYQLGEWAKKDIDDCKLMITYNYRYYGDTSKTKLLNDIKCLEIGGRISRYYSILAERSDSLAEARGKAGDMRPYNAKKELGLSSQQTPGWEDVYFDYPDKGNIKVSALILQYEYSYDEPIVDMDWTIRQEKDTILGYECSTATTSFRGRDYKVWFTVEIPANNGPWKFNNLPGLILKAEDTNGFFSWTATSIIMPKGKKVSFKQGKNVVRCGKKEYGKVRQMTWKDPAQLYLSQGIALKIPRKDGRGLVEAKPWRYLLSANSIHRTGIKRS